MTLWSKERKILVAGAGRSGINGVRLLKESGFRPVLFDENAAADPAAIREKLGVDCELILGELPAGQAKDFQFCVISPGIPLTRPFVSVLKEAGVPVISEIALAYHFSKGRLAAVTGTNGKTTTTALTGHILARKYADTFVVGNIGRAWSTEVLKSHENSATVAEISSFQLETLEDFTPDVSVITNLSPDHLDRHGTFENYVALKKKLASFQREDQYCILNGEDWLLKPGEVKTKAKILYFSSRRELAEGAFLRNGELVLRFGGREDVLCRTDELKILGTHNHENALAAALAARTLGVEPEDIAEGLKSFVAVEHRMEYVCTKNGVRYYNDSKGTNPDAAIKAMEAMTGPTILLAGGYDKHSDYRDWVKSFSGKVKLLILMGATAEAIERTVWQTDPLILAVRAKDMAQAVEMAKKAAVPGDTVLLSPACASWGMYPDFEARGRHFKELVREDP